LISLWGTNGQAWGEDYLEQFFGTLKPQLRKETTDGMMQLVAAGDVDIAVPSSGVNVRKQVQNGAPIAFHCPEPVPTRWSEVGMFRGTPRTHSARIFINWLLSKEGQIALYHATGARPSHVELTALESLQPYPEALRGKMMALTTVDMIENDMRPMFYTWVNSWVEAGGPRGNLSRKVERDD